MTPEEYATLQKNAEARGLKMSTLVRDQLGSLLGSPPNQGQEDDSPEETTEGDWVGARVDLAQWLADRTGTPKAVCALKIARGKVRVAGCPWIDLEAPQALIDDGVTLEGIAV